MRVGLGGASQQELVRFGLGEQHHQPLAVSRDAAVLGRAVRALVVAQCRRRGLLLERVRSISRAAIDEHGGPLGAEQFVMTSLKLGPAEVLAARGATNT